MGDSVICELQNITKRFPGVVALDQVNLSIKKGEILAIVGENGAGKSTLMNILSGVFPPSEGRILYEGQERRFSHTREAQELGIAMIHQELSLSNALSIAENIFQGRLPKKATGLIDKKKLFQDSQKLLEQVGLGGVDVKTLVRDINASQQQQVEIAKALSLHAKLLILDEPTSALTPAEANVLHGVMGKLREEGITMLYISHKLDEIMKISDRIAVFRDGRYIETLITKDTTVERMISLMVGRENSAAYTRARYMSEEDYNSRPVVMEVKNMTVHKKVQDVSFKLYQGEILGITGLVGAGRTELLQAVFGADKREHGEVYIEGKEIKIKHPSDAIKSGMGLVPEGRKAQGLFLEMNVRENMSIVNLKDQISGFRLIRRQEERKKVTEFNNRLRVKTPSLEQKIVNLSGGNQQKVIIARWLMNNPKFLFLDEPTQGIDIGAKTEIYDIIHELSENGMSVIVVSSEMQEIMSLCDRVIVMYEGKVSGELIHSDFEEEKLMTFMSGK